MTGRDKTYTETRRSYQFMRKLCLHGEERPSLPRSQALPGDSYREDVPHLWGRACGPMKTSLSPRRRVPDSPGRTTDLDFVSSGMTFGAVSRLFQQPARH